MADNTRLIKKYPNRRLYDTHASAYITLTDIKNLVLRYEVFQVVDAKSGKDITRSILLQIIQEEESAGGAPMFSSELLAQMIRFYGNAMQGLVGRYIENNVKSFAEMQLRLKDQALAMYGDNPCGQDLWTQFIASQASTMQFIWSAYFEQSRKLLQQMHMGLQGQALDLFSRADGSADPSNAGKKAP